MSEFYDVQDTMVIDEADDFMDDECMVVDECDVPDQEYFVVEDMSAIDEYSPQYIPGTDSVEYVEDEPEEQQAKDWANDGDHGQFVSYVKDKLTKIPKHSGETIPGCERAKAFLKSIDNEISKAMRTDLSGTIDEQEIDMLRKKIQDMIDRLDKQIKKLSGSNKRASLDIRLVSEGHCDTCNSTSPMWHDVKNNSMVCMSCNASNNGTEDSIEKTAGTAVINVYVSAFERAIVGTIINAGVSSGHNIEETYTKLKDKYDFTPREELAIQQLVSDYGYPVFKDRGLLNEPSDPSSPDGVDWITNYYA